MKKNAMSTRAKVCEGIIVLLGLVYIALQLYYGVIYHISPTKYILNIVVIGLVYALLTWLYFHPWRINRLTEQTCTGEALRMSHHMIQAEKLVFLLGLLVPCVCDVIGFEMKEAYSAIVIFLIIAVGVYYEWRIVQAIRKE